LNLARRPHFRLYGGTRFGGTITIEDAWALGFRHVALAAGAGRPTIIGLKNNLLRGVRKASDFLMALQLTGAFKKDALANLQVRVRRRRSRASCRSGAAPPSPIARGSPTRPRTAGTTRKSPRAAREASSSPRAFRRSRPCPRSTVR